MISTHLSNMEQRIRITLVDPVNRRVEGTLRDGAPALVNVWEIPPAFVWPIVGEMWAITRVGGIWKLGQRVEAVDEPKSVELLLPGQGRFDAATIVDRYGRTIVAFEQADFADGDVAVWSAATETWQPVDLAATIAAATTSLPPIGSLQDYAGSGDPGNGWIVADGRELAIVSYPVAASVCGTLYGTLTNGSGGAGATHFRVPDFRGKSALAPINGGTPRGAGANDNTRAQVAIGASGGEVNHALSVAEMPAHRHKTNMRSGGTVAGTDANDLAARMSGGGTSGLVDWQSGAHMESVGGSGGHNNIHPYLAVNKIIRVL